VWERKHALYNRLTRHLGLMIDAEIRLLARLGTVGTVVDIGANYGQTIHGIRRSVRAQRIVAFEPIAELAAGLTREFAKAPEVEIHPLALGRAEAEMSLFIPTYDRARMLALASFDPQSIARFMQTGHAFRGYRPEEVTIETAKVPVRPLDSFGLAPDVVKIDVQGMEQPVVEGGIETFRRHQPLTIVERPRAALVAIFAGLGMRPYALRGGRLHDDWGSGINTLFLSDATRARLGF
jgi:FkbM family methyltransferase